MKSVFDSLPTLEDAIYTSKSSSGVIGTLIHKPKLRALEEAMTAHTEAVDFFAFDNSYARLPDRFFSRLQPTPVAAPRLIRLNKKLAWDLELDPEKLAAPDGV